MLQIPSTFSSFPPSQLNFITRHSTRRTATTDTVQSSPTTKGKERKDTSDDVREEAAEEEEEGTYKAFEEIVHQNLEEGHRWGCSQGMKK